MTKEKETKRYNSCGELSYPPITTPEQNEIINKFMKENPQISMSDIPSSKYGSWLFDENETWIQTYTGRRFTPTKPMAGAIVLEDIAHPLSMQCRFSGHVSKFYSVAQHSVLVSYICDEKDALWGLLHDASEAYIVDIPRPIKRVLKEYVDLERVMQESVCERFGLPKGMPESVKKADDLLLMTEARDLMPPLQDGWGYNDIQPLPFKIEAVSQEDAKDRFIMRFCELTKISTDHFTAEFSLKLVKE